MRGKGIPQPRPTLSFLLGRPANWERAGGWVGKRLEALTGLAALLIDSELPTEGPGGCLVLDQPQAATCVPTE